MHGHLSLVWELAFLVYNETHDQPSHRAHRDSNESSIQETILDKRYLSQRHWEVGCCLSSGLFLRRALQAIAKRHPRDHGVTVLSGSLLIFKQEPQPKRTETVWEHKECMEPGRVVRRIRHGSHSSGNTPTISDSALHGGLGSLAACEFRDWELWWAPRFSAHPSGALMTRKQWR